MHFMLLSWNLLYDIPMKSVIIVHENSTFTRCNLLSITELIHSSLKILAVISGHNLRNFVNSTFVSKYHQAGSISSE